MTEGDYLKGSPMTVHNLFSILYIYRKISIFLSLMLIVRIFVLFEYLLIIFSFCSDRLLEKYYLLLPKNITVLNKDNSCK